MQLYELAKEISLIFFKLFSFPGVGITMVLISIFVTIYYNVIIAYSLYYLFASFQRELPWSKCSISWADGNCSRSPFGKIHLLIVGKDFDAGRDWGQEEKGTTEDEMAGWHHCLDGRESE